MKNKTAVRTAITSLRGHHPSRPGEPFTTRRAGTSYLRDVLLSRRSWCLVSPPACSSRCCRVYDVALIRSTFHIQQAASSSRAVVRAAPSTQDQTEEPRRNARTGVMSMPSTSKPLLFETAARWKLSQRRPDTRDEVAPRPRGRS